MGIDQDGANAASQQCKTNKKKKKKNLNVSTSNCKCSDTSQVLHINGEKCSTAWCATPHEIKHREVNEDCEEAPSKSKKSSKLKKTKANVDLSSDLKKKGRSDQSVKKDCTKLGSKTNEPDVTDVHLNKEVEIAKKEDISKKRKKRNKARKTASIGVSEDCTLDIGEKSQQDTRNDKKCKKIPINRSECAEENEKYEDVTIRSAEEKSCDNQTNGDYKRLSKSKRRRNRKKRILAALGLTGSSQSKTSKTRKRKSNASAACKESAEESSCCVKDVDNSSLSDTVGVKNQDKPFSQNLEKICRSVDTVSSVSERKPLNSPEQVDEKSIEKKLSEGKDRDKIEVLLPLCNFKDDHSSLNNSVCCDASLGVKAGNSNVLKESAKDIDKILIETKILPTASVKQGIEVPSTLSSRKEETFADKVNIPNFLSHDNVEGLFRSALLNDITLSSRCSEKEVKNFFNTYGTFSEKNRSQFAEVEKLLLSSNKIEESGESPLFESEKSVSVASQEKAPFDYRSSCLAASNSEVSDSEKFSCSSSDTGGKPECEGHNSNNSFLNSSCSSGSSLNTTDNVCLNKGSGWGPIYTSPNPENRVINSVNSPQIQRENKTALPPLSSSFNSSLSRPEKSESRLLEIVENVLLVHERVREQLTSEKKLSSQRYCPNLSGTGLFNTSESKEFQEKDLQPIRNKNPCVNSVLKNNKSEVESAEDDLQGQLFKLDRSSNASVVRPLHECLASCLCPEDSVQENSIKHDKTDSDISKMQRSEKTKEEIKAEREAKKMAKMARKMKGASPQDPSTTNCASGGDTKIEKKKNDPVKAQSMSNETCVVPPPTLKEEKVPKNEKRDSSAKHQLASGAIDPPKGDVVDGEILKSKAELRAERRAKQEAQRAAKAQQQHVQPGVKPGKSSVQTEKIAVISAEPTVKSVSAKLTRSSDIGKEIIKPVVMHKVKLFNHLYIKQEASVPKSITATSHLHPAIIRLGVQYATKVVVGSNARCLALLSAVKQVIEDFKTPPQQEFSRGLEAILQPSMAFLQECRPLSVSMTNAVKHLKWQMRHLPNNISDVDAKRKLQEAIDTYIREQLEVAGQAICNTVIRYISDGNVILTYGCSSLLQRILIKAHKSGTKFRVIVVDARPWREGKEMLRRLVENGLRCSYVLITAASFMMREATKVFLGAHALLANGYVMSRAGSSQVALLARSYNVPVLVCCETHKFSERVQTDSIVYNELGAPDELVTADSCSRDHPLSKWKAINSLTPLNITYDVTPPDMVTAVITELAVLPCTSVPVILRVKPTC